MAGENVEVDVLIGAYALTYYLERLLVCPPVGIGRHDPNLANGEDILLSFAGEGRPKIHDVGKLFYCSSTSLEGVALWRTLGDFWDERVRLFEMVSAARKTMV